MAGERAKGEGPGGPGAPQARAHRQGADRRLKGGATARTCAPRATRHVRSQPARQAHRRLAVREPHRGARPVAAARTHGSAAGALAEAVQVRAGARDIAVGDEVVAEPWERDGVREPAHARAPRLAGGARPLVARRARLAVP